MYYTSRMDTHAWVAGLLQKLLADLLRPVIITGGMVVMAWLKSKDWRWVTPLLYSLVTGVCLYIFLYGVTLSPATSLLSPCQVPASKAERFGLGKLLSEMRESGETRAVEIYVESGKKNACLYAAELRNIFLAAGWEPKDIQEIDFSQGGGGMWFHADEQDKVATRFSDWWWRLSEVKPHFEGIKSPDPHRWQFYLKDQW